MSTQCTASGSAPEHRILFIRGAEFKVKHAHDDYKCEGTIHAYYRYCCAGPGSDVTKSCGPEDLRRSGVDQYTLQR